MFFVLSGFILSINYARRGKIEYRDFLAARIARIYPLYLLAALIATPFYLLSTLHDANVSQPILQLAVQVFLTVMLLQAWFPMHASILNAPGWSLSAEWLFYSLFPTVMNASFPRKFLSSTILAISTFWLASVALSSLAPTVIDASALHLGYAIPKNFTLFFTAFNPLLRFPEFLIGCSLGLLHLRKKPFPKAGLVSGFSFLVVTSILFFLPVTRLEPVLHTSLLSPIFGLFILALANTEFSSRNILTSKAMTFLGESSYALYILHEPIRGWLGWGFDKFGINFSEATKVILIIGTCLFVSALAFLWVESPARPLVRAWLSKPKAPLRKA